MVALVNQYGLISDWDFDSANVADNAFDDSVIGYHQTGEEGTCTFSDNGFHRSKKRGGDPANLVVCQRGERNERMLVCKGTPSSSSDQNWYHRAVREPLLNIKYADFHAHTTASDGTFTPTQLVYAANEMGLSFLAITDHDTTAGVGEGLMAAEGTGLGILPGVEISAEGFPGKCHLLGLGIDHEHPELTDTLAELSENRRNRNGRILERLTALGMPLTMEEVIAVAPRGANIGRPHIAQAMVQKEYVPNLKTAFDRYIGDRGPAYVTKDTLNPADAIRLIHAAGGLCFLAHPALVFLHRHETEETRLSALKGLGIDGVEAFYSGHTYAQTGRYMRLAEKMGLLVTGGSDFHGANKPDVPLGIVRYGQRLPADALPPQLLARVR